jgi:uncharacterized protein (DUF58 family)
MAKLKIDLNFSLKRLDLVTKGLVTTQFLGNYASAFKGQGLEFANYRNYIQGNDDASRIDWKASKRVSNLVVKEYVEERNMEVIFLIDVSKKMLTSSVKKLKAEYIAELVASFSYSMLKSGDSVGLMLFSDKIIKYSPPQSGLQQFYSLTEKLSNTNNYGGYCDIDKAMNFIFKKGNENALVILISDFIYPFSNEKNFKLAARKFDLITILIRDPRDLTLPEGEGEIVVEDPHSGETLLINPKMIKKEYASIVNSDINKVKNLMKKIGADFLHLQTDKEFIKPLITFFKSREARWR